MKKEKACASPFNYIPNLLLFVIFQRKKENYVGFNLLQKKSWV